MAHEFPTEVLEEVFSHLHDTKDRTNARSVCRSLAKGGVRFLTSTVYLSRIEYDLNTLATISQHPRVSKTIQRLVCDDRNFASSHQIAEDSRAILCNGGFYIRDEQRRRDSQVWYRKMSLSEWSIRQQALQMALLVAALARMPNLKHIIVTDCFSPPFPLCPVRCPTYQTPFFRTSQWDMDSPAPQRWIKDRCPTDPWNQVSTPYHGLVTLIRALSTVNHAIQTLSIQGRPTGISHRIFSVSPLDFVHITNVFTNIVILKMTIDTPFEDRDTWPRLTLGNGRMARVLAAAGRLEHLEISFMGLDTNAAPRSNPYPDFDIALGLGNFTWLHLRKFALINCILQDHHGLVALLARHAITMRSLRLKYVALERTSWHETFEDCRSQGIQLDECEGSSIWDDFSDHVEMGRVVGYLRGNGPNPSV